MAAHDGSTTRLLDVIRSRDEVSRTDLAAATGIPVGSIGGLLQRHLDAGIVIEGRRPLAPGLRREIVVYRWCELAAPGTKPRQFCPRGGMRKCLCCGKDFHSNGPGNRMCYGCRARSASVSPYAA